MAPDDPPLHLAPLLIVRVAALPFEELIPFHGERARDTAEALLERIATRAREAARISEALYDAAGAPDAERAAARGALLRIRRSVHQGRVVDDALLDAAGPLLTRELRARVQGDREAAEAVARAREQFAATHAEEALRGRAALVAAAASPLVRLGLRLAGRSLLARTAALAKLEAAAWDPRARQVGSKLLAYLARFTTKTSPNGVFCMTALGTLTDDRARVSGENKPARLDFLIHVGEARKITAPLAVSPETLKSARPRPNPTLRREESGWTLWRPATARRPEDDEVRLQVKDHPVLRQFLEEAATTRSTADHLVRSVSERVERDVGPFYAQLVERGLLIGEVEIPWSERRPLRSLAARCPSAPWARDLHEIEDAVDDLSRRSRDAIVVGIDAIAARLESLPHVRPLSEDDLIRCDASTALAIDLPRALLRDLRHLVPRYARLYGALYPEALTRQAFARRFLKKHPADADVPLLDLYHGVFEALDATRPAAFVTPKSGGAGSELLRAARDAFERARDFFVLRAREAAATGAAEVALSEEDWSAIVGAAPEPSFSCAVLFQVAARSIDDVSEGRGRLCVNAFFPGSGLSVARLAWLHACQDAETNGPITRQLAEGWRRQERPGTIHAEITFMHGGRTANAGLRPPIFPFEIELPGDCAGDGRERIPLSDLTARWESAAGRFVIRSVSRGVEVLPVISSGINPEGFVSFLTMVGAQGLQPLGFLPGFDETDISSWPRFTFGNVVLFRRRWVFERAAIPANAGSPEEHYLATQGWRRAHGLPLHVFVHSEGDPKPFYVNLGSELFVDRLRRGLAERPDKPIGRVHVTEMLPGPEELWVRDARGRYASEFLVHVDNLEPSMSDDVP